ncbi:hypothetical protein ACFL1X_06275 [Candidatus Hydrogenedentota bacterium]
MRTLPCLGPLVAAVFVGLPIGYSYAEGSMGIVERNDLYGVRIDDGAKRVTCRTVPFLACDTKDRGKTRRIVTQEKETIPVGAKADTLYLMGMFNEGWDHAHAHWGEHREFTDDRPDRIVVGTKVGKLELAYDDGSSDRIPLVIGTTVWHVSHWAYGKSSSVMKPIKEPFASRPELAKILSDALKLYEDDELPWENGVEKRYKHFYLAIAPRDKVIKSIVIHDDTSLRGRSLVSGVTIASREGAQILEPFGTCQIDAADMPAKLEVTDSMDWSKELKALADIMYTRESDLPDKVDLIDFPQSFDAARITFESDGRWGDMLSNVWTANLTQIDEKFEKDTGIFRETGKDCPWYGGYQGIGTWAPDIGVYSRWCYGRSSDHLATVGLRLINSPERWVNYVDLCDKYLYYHRSDHDPSKGPPNDNFDAANYPKDAPPHWCFVLNEPQNGHPREINDIPGNEEMDGHGATVVGRWVAWKMLGCPNDEWLTSPRNKIYGKSRWDSSYDSAEFICWLMDHTGRDVIYSEGESTGWGGGPDLVRVPRNMTRKLDRAGTLKKYAEADMYEVYPSFVCSTALKCSAEIAETLGKNDIAAKWRAYSDRIRKAMRKELTTGPEEEKRWSCTPSVFPSEQEALAPAWFSTYLDGYYPRRWDPVIAGITRNYLKYQLGRGPKTAAVLAMGYGQGWLTHATLFMDEMDAAGECLVNIAKYSYDKNMDYVDPERGIDWRKWLWLIPEGSHKLPDGAWYRIGDLTNGANQGPAMHALEACAGVDYTDARTLRILPRAPEPLTGLKVDNFMALIEDEGAVKRIRLSYEYKKNESFSLESDGAIPSLALRLGPYDNKAKADAAAKNGRFPESSTQRIEQSGTYHNKQAWWLWIEEMQGVSHLDISLVSR